MKALVAAALSLAVFAGGADAAAKKKKKGDTLNTTLKIEEQFSKLDTNKDGKVSFEEFKDLSTVLPRMAKGKAKSAPTPDYAGIFSKLDTNSNNSLNLDEFKKLPAVMAESATPATPKKKKAK